MKLKWETMVWSPGLITRDQPSFTPVKLTPQAKAGVGALAALAGDGLAPLLASAGEAAIALAPISSRAKRAGMATRRLPVLNLVEVPV